MKNFRETGDEATREGRKNRLMRAAVARVLPIKYLMFAVPTNVEYLIAKTAGRRYVGTCICWSSRGNSELEASKWEASREDMKDARRLDDYSRSRRRHENSRLSKMRTDFRVVTCVCGVFLSG